ncbi:MaoC family dehydratase [Domibacillus indicus]|uniref:MaoC family dehydratase n=1 Tax=Domibacillus indicus TaxID=1437523 RepID=UPI000617E8A0|nr:MaoC family dehydratase [Domibacillus indicus]
MFNPIPWIITADDIRAYAEASGDNNPIHTDPAYAKKAGLPGCIAHGMLVMALGSRALKEWGAVPLASYDVRFQGMTFPDEPLVVKGSWINEAEGKGSIIIESETGEVKMKGTFAVNRNEQ